VAGLALTLCGTEGATGPVGVTAFDAAEAGPLPVAFDAWTTIVYEVPAVSPDTVVLVAGGEPDTVVANAVCAVDPT
jgi:hypothetical protein